jgi:hypothetical protein
MPYPISFTDVERDIIANAAEPISQEHRPAFLEAVANALASHTVLGEGLVHRTCRELQKSFLDLPGSPPPGSKYSRRGNTSRAWRG